MTRTAGTLMLAVAVSLAACSKAIQEGGAASDLASPARIDQYADQQAGHQRVTVVTEYVGKVAGPDVANILKSAFPA